MSMDVITINTDQVSSPVVGADLFENRSAIVEMQSAQVDVSVIVMAYNRLEKTRRCVESILQYTKGINYELILIDNGSTDETLEYFRSIPYSKKKIFHITKNLGSSYPYLIFRPNDLGRFVCILANDLIVTAHWMENLLICIKSDAKIGLVNPVCSNTSNLQCVQLPFKSYMEMQQEAERFNHSDPSKWEERQRLITLGPLFRKEVLLACGWPICDLGFFHDFGDDDITFRIRRMGYRTVLAGDTWICHDHDLWHGEGKDPAEFQKSLDIGRENFREKFFGVDAWEDVNNFYIPYLPHFPKPSITGRPQILGVDTKCGTPVLDIKNWLRTFGLFDTDLSAFTQDPKYWLDLKTICRGPVVCDREEFLTDSFPRESFDYVVADRPLNRYHEPAKMLRDLFSLCKKGGYVVCRLTNAYSFREYLNLLGQADVFNPEYALNIPVGQFRAAVQQWGTIQCELQLGAGLDRESQTLLASLYPAGLPEEQRKTALEQMQCQEYLFVAQKQAQ